MHIAKVFSRETHWRGMEMKAEAETEIVGELVQSVERLREDMHGGTDNRSLWADIREVRRTLTVLEGELRNESISTKGDAS